MPLPADLFTGILTDGTGTNAAGWQMPAGQSLLLSRDAQILIPRLMRLSALLNQKGDFKFLKFQLFI
jgi:hypothetical protein